ncbi:hypothetical protein JHK82_056017 [Glycine max]|nr:hypothetical protein JHK82_056017 [Glycine max]
MQQPEKQINAPAGMPLPERRRRRRSSGICATSGVRVQPQEEQQQVATRGTVLTDSDQFYFNWYAHIDVHEEMIKDRVRTDAYKNAIMRHKDFIRDKVVLDVGCGTGILAIFCAQAGARRVYAVEASNIALQTIRVVEANNLLNIITVLHGRVEVGYSDQYILLFERGDGTASAVAKLGWLVLYSSLYLNPEENLVEHDRVMALVPEMYDVEIGEKVDVIISEWMGYMLLCESMLGSVITARDRWLKPGGLVLPSKATLYMAPFTHAKRYRESIDFWRSVYGINMSAMVPLAKQCAFVGPSVETITSENVLAWPQVDIHTLLSACEYDLKFSAEIGSKAPLHGFAFWFDVEFTRLSPEPISFQLSTSLVDDHPVGSQRQDLRDPTLLLSTAPEALPTHWQQTLIYFYEPIELEQDQLIEGKVTLSQSQENHRNLNIELVYATGGQSYVKVSVM